MLICNQNDAPITAVVVLAGDAPAPDELDRLRSLLTAEKPPLLLAADGGADHLARAGLLPDLLLGDADSLRGDFSQVRCCRYEKEKDFSDGEAALAYALEETSGRVLLLGALGGRLDHLLTNVLMPLHLSGGAERVLLSGPGMEGGYSLGEAQVSGEIGETLSLIPLAAAVEGIRLSGLYYPLENYDTPLGSSRTLSNVLAAPEAKIQHRSGILLLLHYHSLQAYQ